MIVLKGFKTCVIIDNREQRPTLKYKNSVVARFLSKIVDKDFISTIEVYNKNVLIETISNGVVGGLTSVNSLKHLKIIK